MIRRTWLCVPAVALAASLMACGGDPASPASPGSIPAGLLGANPDGSTLKVTQPGLQSPVGGQRLENVTPVFRLSNAQGVHVPVDGLDYELELIAPGGQVIYRPQIGRGPGQTVHTYPGDLEFDTQYSWRARAIYQGRSGPWSDTGTFVTTERPPAVAIEDLEAYLIAFSNGNANWSGCAAGSGTSCFRFVYEAVQSMNPTCDPNSWGLLSKNPGEQQCTLFGCGRLGGEGFGEDIVTHGGFSPILLWDVVTGAGAPGATLGASSIPRDNRRPGNNWACPWGR